MANLITGIGKKPNNKHNYSHYFSDFKNYTFLFEIESDKMREDLIFIKILES